MKIGDRVKALRIKKGLTQMELAEMLGYKSKSSVAHIENGRDIPRSMVVKLAEVLDSTPAYIMGWESDQQSSADKNRWERMMEQYDKMSPDERKRIDAVLDAFFPDETTHQTGIIKETTVGAEQDRRAVTDDEAEETA